MRLAIYLVLFITPVFWGNMGESGDGPVVRTLTEKDTGKSVSLKVGDTLALDLRNPASGGYTDVRPYYNRQILQLEATRNIPPDSGPMRRMGDFGRLRLEFKAVRPGATDLVVQISRPWEQDKGPLEYTRNRVTVSQ
jgi:predicted secreted protein